MWAPHPTGALYLPLGFAPNLYTLATPLSARLTRAPAAFSSFQIPVDARCPEISQQKVLVMNVFIVALVSQLFQCHTWQ